MFITPSELWSNFNVAVSLMLKQTPGAGCSSPRYRESASAGRHKKAQRFNAGSRECESSSPPRRLSPRASQAAEKLGRHCLSGHHFSHARNTLPLQREPDTTAAGWIPQLRNRCRRRTARWFRLDSIAIHVCGYAAFSRRNTAAPVNVNDVTVHTGDAGLSTNAFAISYDMPSAPWPARNSSTTRENRAHTDIR